MEEDQVKKIVGQIDKQIEVIKAFYHNDDDTIFQESAMYKLNSSVLFEERESSECD
jgi:acetolactate synthase-1/3 small subunit